MPKLLGMKMANPVGYAFLGGATLATLNGLNLFSLGTPLVLTLAAGLGLLAGMVNIRRNERVGFMVAVGFIVGSGSLLVSSLSGLGPAVQSVFQSIGLFGIAMGLVPAFREIWEKGRK